MQIMMYGWREGGGKKNRMCNVDILMLLMHYADRLSSKSMFPRQVVY